jgi:hypothetical protein
MAGLAGTITPATTGTAIITICGSWNSLGTGVGLEAQIYYGTGTAPALNASVTGTATAARCFQNLAGETNTRTPFSLTARITGLTLNTAVWVDLLIISSANVTLERTAITSFEI